MVNRYVSGILKKDMVMHELIVEEPSVTIKPYFVYADAAIVVLVIMRTTICKRRR